MSREGQSGRQKTELRRMALLFGDVTHIQRQRLHGPSHQTASARFVPRQRGLLEDGDRDTCLSQTPRRASAGWSTTDYDDVIRGGHISSLGPSQ
jgi:hypothetical protein